MDSSGLESRVLDFIRQQRLLPCARKLVVAVSGGPDSVCLFHILYKLKNELGISLHIAHLDHQLRGADSEADASYVAALAQRFTVPATIASRDVEGYRAQHRLSLEEAAREVRYGFLAEVAQDTGAERIAVGHTANDHVETILMHLIRGSGTRGLRGLQPSTTLQPGGRRITIIRPLLPLSHEETVRYCQDNGLNPRLDTSNLSFSPLRNRIRIQLLPLLQSYNPNVSDALQRTARLAADELDFFDREVVRVWPQIVREQKGSLTLNKTELMTLHPALKRLLLLRAVESLLPDPKDVEMRHIDEMMATLDKPAGRRLSLPDGLIFSVEYDRYLLGGAGTAQSPFSSLVSEYPLRTPGETVIPGWYVTARLCDAASLDMEPGQSSTSGDGWLDLTACFDFDRMSGGLVARPRRRGDRFVPFGMKEPKKLGQYMIDAKIPAAWRDSIPIVASPQQIVWVVGYRIDERVKVTDKTQRVLCLKFQRV